MSQVGHSGRSTDVFVVAPSFHSSFHVRVQAAIASHLRGRGRIKLRSLTDDPTEQTRQLDSLLGEVRTPSSLIAISVRLGPGLVRKLHDVDMTICLIDEITDGVPTVTTDNYRGGMLAGEHLVSRGRRKIGIISGMINVAGGYNADQRVKGLKQALVGTTATIVYHKQVVHYSEQEGHGAAPDVILRGVDAVFCAAGDACAHGLVKELQRGQAKVPEVVAVVGYDDLDIASIMKPNLTTVQQPIDDLAAAALDIVLDRDGNLSGKYGRRTFNPSLIARSTT